MPGDFRVSFVLVCFYTIIAHEGRGLQLGIRRSHALFGAEDHQLGHFAPRGAKSYLMNWVPRPQPSPPAKEVVNNSDLILRSALARFSKDARVPALLHPRDACSQSSQDEVSILHRRAFRRSVARKFGRSSKRLTRISIPAHIARSSTLW